MRCVPTTVRLACVVSALSTVIASFAARPAAADVDVGVRGGYYTDAEDGFLGA